jgi:predicted glutamine amidotransferase
MCELLGMSANVPTDLRFSFAGLIRRAGETGRHTDGFGVAFHDGDGCRVFHDPAPGARSPLAVFLRTEPIRSRIAIAHIRRANRGRVAVANTHPFQRELWGRWWIFAHNGQLKGVKRWPLTHYRPVGTTDSEHAFCWLLGELRSCFERMPSERTLCRALEELYQSLHALGTFNALLSDGLRLYASCSNRLVWLTRRAPFGPARLVDDDLEVDFAKETTPDDVVTVLATRPLTTDEQWHPVDRGTLAVFRDGERIAFDADRSLGAASAGANATDGPVVEQGRLGRAR